MNDMRRQLYMMGEMQRLLIPREIPQCDGWHSAVDYRVGLWPGGDYYDFISLPDGRLSLLIADASDVGAPSTALAAMLRVILHSCPLSSGREQLPFCPVREPVLQPPHILLEHLNCILEENTLAEQFMTAFCMVLDPFDGTINYSNAGHLPPRHWRASCGTVQPLPDLPGLPLGTDRRATYHRKWTEMDRGDLLALYSDGLTAALNDAGEGFGTRRLDEILQEAGRWGAEAFRDTARARLTDFLGDREPADDVTLLVLERLR